MGEKNNHSRREFLGKAFAAVAVAAFDPVTVFLSDKDIFASGANETLGQFIIDINLTKYGALKNINGSVAVAITKLSKPFNRIIVMRTGTAGFSVVNGHCNQKRNVVNDFKDSVITFSQPASAGHGSTVYVDGTGLMFSGPGKQNTCQLQ